MGSCWVIFGIMGNRWPIFRIMGNCWPIFRIMGDCWPLHRLPMESIREMYEKIDPVEQIDPLITFVENQLQKMKTPSEAGSSSSEGRSLTDLDGTELAAKTINAISTEAEKLSNLDPVEALRSVTSNVMKEVGDLYWVFIGLSVAAYSVEKYLSVCYTEKECRELLLNILEHATNVEQYKDKEMLLNAVGTIVEGAVIFCDYLKMGKISRFVSHKTDQQLRDVMDSVGLLDFQPQDVFLSHSGKQKNFVRQLYRDLTREDVSCFFDEDRHSLPLGQKFPRRMLKAAERCKIAVVVLSKEFIRSKWPMIELSTFISTINSGKNSNLEIIPIFFKINPREVPCIPKEWQNLGVNNGTRSEWQHALNEVRSIYGPVFAKGGNAVHCREEVFKMISSLLRAINPPKLLDFKPVGIEDQVREVMALLDMKGTESSLAVNVYGFGGGGKSTVAASVVDSLDWSSTDFKFCRVAIDETHDKTSHIVNLQKHILYVLGGDEVHLGSTLDGQKKIKQVLQNKSCLLFIDNVVDKVYFQDLLPQNLFPAAEQKTKLRIIITSRENNLKTELKIIWKEYEVKGLSDAASKHLLLEKILQSSGVKNKDEEDMINDVAVACRGVPLLLSVFGKHLGGERDGSSYQKERYEEVLEVLREGNLDSYRDEKLGSKLMFVYKKIKDMEVKEAFLDICTYYHGREWNLVIDILDLTKLEDLQRRALVSKSISSELIVHDILRFMGMKEARLTRFSNYKELSHALEGNLDGFDMKDVKGISLLGDDSLITIESTKLDAMHQSLRVLMLGDWVKLDGPLCQVFRNLRYLHVGDITAFPFEDPSKLDKLRVFLNRSEPGMNLSHLPSSIKHISHEVPYVECDQFVKLPFENLRCLKSFIVKTKKSVELPEELHLPKSLVDLKINRCKNLPKDIGHLTALESAILRRSDLECLPQGFRQLQKLRHLSIDYCSKLTFLPEELGMLSSLEVLSMKGCGSLRAFPERLGGLLSLQTLEFSECMNLQELPESIGQVQKLRHLSMDCCSKLTFLPEELGMLSSLEVLSMKGCGSLRAFPERLGGLLSLQTLEFSECINLQELPESIGQLRIQSLNLHSLFSLNELPASIGNMPLLKYLSLKLCNSLTSLPNSFVQLTMLETLKIIHCTKLRVLPEDFGQLRCLNHMTVERCQLLKELPHGFRALPALKTFKLRECNSVVNLPRDFGELTSLEELRLQSLPLISRTPDGFGNLKKLRLIEVKFCDQLKTFSDNFENMAALERLSIKGCSELDGAMMGKIVKLPNCYMAEIDGSTKMLEKWKQMQSEAEYPIVVLSGGNQEEERKRAIRVALLHGKCMELKNDRDQLMERSSLLVGLEEGTRTTVALIMLPFIVQSNQDQTLQRCVEMARERAETNGSGNLQIVCARKVNLDVERPTPTEEEERAEEEGIRQILLSLPKGSCAILFSEYKRVKVLTRACELFYYPCDELTFFMANVGVDIEGSNSFENFKFTEEDEISVDVPSASEMREPPQMGKSNNSIQNFVESICEEGGRSQSQSAVGESKTKEFIKALKENGIHYLLTHNHSNKVMVEDLQGKAIGFIICNFHFFGWIKLQQIYNDLQERDSNFIVIWVPSSWAEDCGYGSYTRLIQCMPWATFPYPQLVNDRLFAIERNPRFVILDKDGQIANPDALPLLLGWGAKSYPFTQHTIPECFPSVVESESCLEFLLHGMNIVGRKPMRSKMTFLLAQRPSNCLTIDWLTRKSKLEELTRIHGSFEVLHVGKLVEDGIYRSENAEQDYENAIQSIPWPSLSFSDMIMFWYRCKYLAYQLNKDSNTMMEALHGFAKQLWGVGTSLGLVDNGGVVTCGGEDVVEMMCDSSDGEGLGRRMVKDELMKSLNSGECTPLVRTFFRDEIHNHPQHPQHPISVWWRYSTRGTCDVCGALLRYCEEWSPRRSYECRECNWDICGKCWMAYAIQQVEQLVGTEDN